MRHQEAPERNPGVERRKDMLCRMPRDMSRMPMSCDNQIVAQILFTALDSKDSGKTRTDFTAKPPSQETMSQSQTCFWPRLLLVDRTLGKEL